jgi:hypothetical protein
MLHLYFSPPAKVEIGSTEAITRWGVGSWPSLTRAIESKLTSTFDAGMSRPQEARGAG